MGNILDLSFLSSGEDVEVYIVYKMLGRDAYFPIKALSHHILVFKTSNGQFYYTELDTSDGRSDTALSGEGRIRVRFGRYYFVNDGDKP